MGQLAGRLGRQWANNFSNNTVRYISLSRVIIGLFLEEIWI